MKVGKAPLVLTLFLGTLFVPFSRCEAQQPGKVPRIGYLSAGSRSSASAHTVKAFLQRLHELGYTVSTILQT